MTTSERELAVLKEVYRVSLPDLAEQIFQFYSDLDKLRASEFQWSQLRQSVHQMALACQWFEFELLSMRCFELEDILDRLSTQFYLSHLREIEERLLQIKDLALASSMDYH